jgi:hypothetical protein
MLFHGKNSWMVSCLEEYLISFIINDSLNVFKVNRDFSRSELRVHKTWHSNQDVAPFQLFVLLT